MQIPQENLDRIGELIEPWFMFSLIWTVGATGDNNGRKKFDQYLREKIKEHGVSECSPIRSYSLVRCVC